MNDIAQDDEVSVPKLRIADVPAVILAGGLATRLGTIAQQAPKAMVEVAGRPFIDHQLALLRRRGFTRVVLCVGHLGTQLEAHLGAGAGDGLHIEYSYDGPGLLGTGGALRRAAPLLGDLFWVMYGDSFMDMDYAAVLAHFERSGALGLMTILRNDDRWDRSNVAFDAGRLLRYDKRNRTPDMRHIDYGVALLRREALLRIPPARPHDLADLYRDLVAEGRMAGYEVNNRFYEIGTPESLEETRRYLVAAGL